MKVFAAAGYHKLFRNLIAIFKIMFCFTFVSTIIQIFFNVVPCSVKEHVQLSK